MPILTTYSGVRLSLMAPEPALISIEDIAHSLSNMCRFAGATKRFYSVAQHSVIVSEHCAPEHRLDGLLHDAAEAYCTDIPRPLKYLPGMEGYREVENRLQRAIAAKFRIAPEIPASVKQIDAALLRTECMYLLRVPPDSFDNEADPLPLSNLPCWSPRKAKQLFLDRYQELTALPLHRSGLESTFLPNNLTAQ